MRGGYIGHVLAFAIVVRIVICVFVCDVWFVCLFVLCCNVCVAVLLGMSRRLSSTFVMYVASLSVLVDLLASLVLFTRLHTWCRSLLRVVIYAWRFS